MNEQPLRNELDRMALLQGVQGCALVEIETGMAWYVTGQSPDIGKISEAASDYWRLYERLNNHFTRLGDMRAAVFMHRYNRITLLPCGKDKLLVALTHEKTSVDWTEWQLRVRALASRIDHS